MTELASVFMKFNMEFRVRTHLLGVFVALTAVAVGCAGGLEKPDDFDFIKQGGSGGVQASGGDLSTGGSASTGGSQSTGGVELTGGSQSTGGVESTGGDMQVGLPEPTACAAEIFTDRCGTPGCHNARTTGSLDLVSPGVAGRLLDGEAGPGACSGEVFVSSGSGEDLLISKLSTPALCGSPMPLTGGALTDTEKLCLSDYVAAIKAGAP